jgi:hypothetical protein
MILHCHRTQIAGIGIKRLLMCSWQLWRGGGRASTAFEACTEFCRKCDLVY